MAHLACTKYEKHKIFVWKPVMKKSHFKDQKVHERIVILNWVLEKNSVDCIHIAQNRIQWWAFVNVVMNDFRLCSSTTQETGIFVLTAVRTSHPTW
jgi:hypothetical protein